MTSSSNEIRLAITGMGLVTPVGHDVASACAALRADISRLRELDEFPENVYLRLDSDKIDAVGGRAAGITDGHLGLGRFARLAAPAFKQAWETARSRPEDARNTGLLLALPPKDRLDRDERLETFLPKRLRQRTGIDLNAFPPVHYIYDGNVSAIAALSGAAAALSSRKATRVLIGCVDSLIEPATLIWLSESKQLKTKDRKDGLLPGEAAAFLLVETVEEAVRRKAKILSVVSGISIGQDSEKGTRGAGLTEVIQKSLATLQDGAEVGLVICDLNGQRARATEWGYARTRAFQGKHIDPGLWHPADCIGDTGAASGGLSIIQATVALQKEYAKTDNVLVWSSGEGGRRAAALVSKG